MRKFNRFQPHTSVFTCRCCGRKSRETARNSGAGDICGQCYDLAGIENEISDGHCTAAERKGEVLALTRELSAAGGSLEEWVDLLDRVRS
jgi:hypothetical protein